SAHHHPHVRSTLSGRDHTKDPYPSVSVYPDWGSAYHLLYVTTQHLRTAWIFHRLLDCHDCYHHTDQSLHIIVSEKQCACYSVCCAHDNLLFVHLCHHPAARLCIADRKHRFIPGSRSAHVFFSESS